MKRIITLLLMIIITITSGCTKAADEKFNSEAINSYKEIPGVTESEIEAIEAIKEKKSSFTYGHLLVTESFMLPDGTYQGFTVQVSQLLSKLFDIEFNLKPYREWNNLKGDIDNLKTDFSGEFTQTPERMEEYLMTDPIAGRSLNIYTLEGSHELVKESDVEGYKIGFLEDTVTDELIRARYPEAPFETVEVKSFSEAAEMLRLKEINAFVTDGVADTVMSEYTDIKGKPFFLFVFSPVSLTTKNIEFKPIIDVVNKYLESGGMDTLFKLYEEGDYQYKKNKLFQSFTPEELAFLEDCKEQGRKINIALQHDAYPASFYNTVEKRYEGAAVDILKEVSELTGLEFDSTVMPIEKPLSDILAKLKGGEVSMMPQLLYSESRKNDYLWSDISYITTNYALLSKSDFPKLEPFQVYYAKVGTVNKSAHEEVFHEWFPGHKNTVVYQTGDEGFDGLEKGEVDLLMLAETMLLVQTNYREKPGYKVNVKFNKTLDTLFGYNKDEVLLRNIVDKAMTHIDVETIENEWLNKVFDYSQKVTKIQTTFVTIFAIVVLIVLIVILFLFEKNRKLGKNLMVAVEEAREASNVKSQFLANMSHEIRTPMNAIIGMSEILLSEPLNSRQQAYTKDINASSHSLLAIINDILDFSKIEAGKLELNNVDYDFTALINNIRSMFKFVIERKELEFIYEESGEIPYCLFGDDIRLKQVLTNICGNAVKFTFQGYVKLRVVSGEETLRFDIEDSGMGIKEEDLPKLFTAFSQADTVKNRSIKGTGLGLTISKSFVDMMGGNITVQSEYGKGTTFSVEIPKILGDEEAIKRSEGESDDEAFYAPTAKILVVDDNEVNIKVAKGLLHLFSIEADSALSGPAAIEMVSETDYDIVFMDHMMPEMDGIEATAEIRKLGGKYETLKIVALTANAIRGAKEMFIENGLDGFISKPIEISELTEILREWLPPEKIERQDGLLPTEFMEADAVVETPVKVLGFIEQVGEISAINTEIGLSRVSNITDMYQETVELFYRKLLSECDKMEEFVKNGEIQSFAISVHGIKSSLSTIGAMELSDTAFKLETAAKEDDADYCVEQLPGFLEKLRIMHEQLSAIIQKDKDEPKGEEGDMELLREKVQAALDAADDFDGDLAVEAIEELLEFDYGAEINEKLEKASSALKDFDFDAAVEVLKGI